MNFIARRQKIRDAKTSIIAYRLSKTEQNMTHESRQSLQSGSDTGIFEGYDDGNEEGAGEKLLSQLQKMGVENILIVVYLWHQKMPG